MNNEGQKLSFVYDFFFKRLYNQPARARGKNTYVQELVDEVKHTVDSCEDLFLWLRQNLDHYWVTQLPWTVEVAGFSDIPYLKVTFDYKLNEKGEVDVDVDVHFNKEPNMIVVDFNRTEI